MNDEYFSFVVNAMVWVDYPFYRNLAELVVEITQDCLLVLVVY